MRIAVAGCGHGTLNAIYASVNRAVDAQGWSGVDVLIIGGDFQSVRNESDLQCMSVPAKYAALGDFHEYYSGSKRAPYLTLFASGNHEASNYLSELHFGGWVAPSIFYIGASNVVRVGDLRIAGLSGIWKGYNYNKPHFERAPYTPDEVRSIYHTREIDVRRLRQLRSQVDVVLSHDWPRGIERHGNFKKLWRQKPDFEGESADGTLGSVAAQKLLDWLKPRYWFAAHLHVKFAAEVHHAEANNEEKQREEPLSTSNPDEIDLEGEGPAPDRNPDEIDLDAEGTAQPDKNPDEIDLDDEEEQEVKSAKPAKPAEAVELPQAVPASIRDQLPSSFKPQAKPSIPELDRPSAISNTTTRFLALDKCLPARKYLQLLEIDTPESKPTFSYDKEWLAISRVFANEPDGSDRGSAYYRPLIEAEMEWVETNLGKTGKMAIPDNFEQTAPPYPAEVEIKELTNPQTTQYCSMLEIQNPFDATEQERQERAQEKATLISQQQSDSGVSRRGGRGGFRGRGGRGGRGRGRGRGFRGQGR